MADNSSRTTESRRLVTCELCGNKFQLRHLKDHTNRIHKGKKPTVRPAANRRTLQFAVKRVSESEDNTHENPKVARVEEPEEETNDNVGLDVVITEKQHVEDNVDVNLVTNEEIMKEIKLSTNMIMESMNELQKDKNKKDNKNSEETENQDLGHVLGKARTFAEIANLFSEMKYNEDEKVFTCDLCYDENHCTQQHIGLIKVETIKEPKDKQDPMSDAFRNLKKRIKTHTNSQIHKQKINDLKIV